MNSDSGKYIRHFAIEIEGFRIADATAIGAMRQDNFIRVGYGGQESRWLSPQKVRAVARALEQVVASHNVRRGNVDVEPWPDPSHIVFNGRSDAGDVSHVEIVEDGVPRPLPYHLALANLSPAGFAWGYDGAGPTQLALAMCAELMSADRALRHHGAVRDRLVSTIDQKDASWSLYATRIMEVVAEFEGS